MADAFDSLYAAGTQTRQAFSPAWCGPERFEHGVETLVAIFPGEPDGQDVSVYCTAMPAAFFKIVVFPVPDKLGYELTTGSGYMRLTGEIARAIAQGMLCFGPPQE